MNDKAILDKIKQPNFCKNISGSKIVAQQIIKNPVLFKKKKVDFRDYLIVYSFSPLKFELVEGFARIARTKYSFSHQTVILLEKIFFNEYFSWKKKFKKLYHL